MWRFSVVAGWLMVCAGGVLSAQSTESSSYFGARHAGLTFSERVVQVSLGAVPDLEAVTSIGDITFENALVLKAPAGSSYPIPGGAVTNGFAEELDVVIRLHFVSAVTSVAFQLFAQSDFGVQTNPFLEAFLAGRSLGRFELKNAQTLVGLDPSESLDWFGLENSVFDRLDIIAPIATITPDGAPPFTQVQGVGVSNIEYETPPPPAPVEVPEPSSVALLMLGAVGVGVVATGRSRGATQRRVN